MDEDKKELQEQDSQNLTDEEIEDAVEEAVENDDLDADEAESLRRKLEAERAEKEELAQKNKQLYERAKKAESQKKTAQRVQEDLLEDDDDGDIAKRIGNLEQTERKRQFGYEHGLSPEETDAVFKIDPNPTEKTLSDPFVRGGLASIRRKQRLAKGTPSPSPSSFSVGGKKWAELSKEEKQANFDKYRSSVLKKRG